MTNNNVGELYRGMKERLENEAYVSNEVVCYVERVMGKKHCEDRGGETCCVACEERFTKNILAALEDAYELGKLKNDYWCGSAFEKGAELGMELAKEEALPHFDNGKLIEIGDYYINKKGSISRVSKIDLRKNGISLGVPTGYFEYGEPVKFAENAVLDCNGTLIGINDTVWDKNTGASITVKSVSKTCVRGYNGECLLPENVSHKKPKIVKMFEQPEVYDADGVKIEVGETRFGGDGVEWTVTEFDYNHKTHPIKAIAKKEDGKPFRQLRPEWLSKTPRELDIFDADGEPIKFHRTMWHVNGSKPLQVVGVVNSNKVKVQYIESGCVVDVYADLLSCQRSVRDADNVRIKAGDIVWTTNPLSCYFDKELKVKFICEDENVLVTCDGENSTYFLAKWLSHKKQDSQRKINNDVKSLPSVYWDEVNALLKRQRELNKAGA